MCNTIKGEQIQISLFSKFSNHQYHFCSRQHWKHYGAITFSSGDASRISISRMFGCKPREGVRIHKRLHAGLQDINAMYITKLPKPWYLHFICFFLQKLNWLNSARVTTKDNYGAKCFKGSSFQLSLLCTLQIFEFVSVCQRD